MDKYELRLDFVPDSSDPSRVFHSMGGVIDSFNRFDRDFLSTLDLMASCDLLLHDIERGSLRAILRWILKLPDKEALRDGDWNKLLGRAIDDAREYFLGKLEERPLLETKEQIVDIQKNLVLIGGQLPVGLLPVPAPLSLARILGTIQSFEESTRMLIHGDTIQYHSEYRVRQVCTSVRVSPDLQAELLDAVPITNVSTCILPVKKPDFLSESQWELYQGKRVIRAKILDHEWLVRYHDNSIELRPGDALKARLEVTMFQSKEGEIVGERYAILKILEVIPQTRWRQMNILEYDRDDS